ncbi:hypothetical protein M6B38_132795 [Iris pallida]|uniref:Uncharacterized protein n=1 Tax=Iris pallida TaxID=29817 RepID=A0AAX6FHR1_IRIPA|nr:hypothetical protein M6B38_132795 [Iris pallida]
MALYYKEFYPLADFVHRNCTNTHTLSLSLSLSVWWCVCLLLTAAVARPLAGLGFPILVMVRQLCCSHLSGGRDEDFLLLMARQFRCSHLSERG